MGNWYLIKTKPRQENVAIKNLENQEYSTYCATVTINNKHVVLFPGYIFIMNYSKRAKYMKILIFKIFYCSFFLSWLGFN